MEIGFSKRRMRGFTLVELIVIIALIAVFVGMILPALAPPHRTGGDRIKCINNLKNTGLAFRIFATDNQGRYPTEVSTNEGGSLEFFNEGAPFRHFVALSNELSTPKIIHCPMDNKRN